MLLGKRRGGRARGRDPLSFHTQLIPERDSLQLTSQQGPSPTLGPGASPQLLPEAGVETEEEMGEGRPGSSSLYSPSSLATIFRPLPPRAAGDGAQPVEGRERASEG